MSNKKRSTKSYQKNDDLYKFRKYLKVQGKKKLKHPKLIVDEFDEQFGFMGLTSSKYKGRGHKNIELCKNPQIIKGFRRKDPSFLRRKIEYDFKNQFSEILDDYILSDEDKKRLKQYVELHKKKR